MERKVYRVRTQYVFEGVFEVVATNREEAERKILEDCGMVMGRGVHTILSDEQINWAFETHPEERIPQFRSVFSCEAILYVEMSFWGSICCYEVFRGFLGLVWA